ncbi:Abi family protein [Chitinophaga defluvii]|uniref:Abi family protein n=1 Tax=Chitinophaga defluvii TaxID=3163343 RepID=A0ABV2TDL1_9BACT
MGYTFWEGILVCNRHMTCNKPATTISDQLIQLKTRGLIIADEPLAACFLSNTSYYRLAGYWWPMQADKINHLFKPNSKFEDVIALYEFDSALRLLLFNVIERIEIALRSKMIYHLSHEHGPWWFQDSNLFINSREHIKTLAHIEDELQRSKDIFIKDHFKRYKNDQRFPPSWKTLEITSFGSLSKLYGNLKPSVKSKDIIAWEFKTVNHTFLPSWLQSIAQIRNICAHHGRLWNKNLPGRPHLLSRPPAPWLASIPPVNEHHMLYVHACCMKYLLNVINPKNQYCQEMSELLDEYPSVDQQALGFPAKWKTEPLWLM